MQPVHLYLGAWVAGGLLLGASLLLDGREARPPEDVKPRAVGDGVAQPAPEPPAADALEPPPPASGQAPLPSGGRLFRLCSLALIGFGLCGLTAKGLDLDLWPWTLVSALVAGLLLFGLGYRLSRVAPGHTRL